MALSRLKDIMTTAKKSATKKSSAKSASKKTSAPRKSAAKKTPKKTATEGNHCWPGFEPVPGKMAGEKGSCEPKPGKKSASVKKADQKAAAASKLQKQGKPNPNKH